MQLKAKVSVKKCVFYSNIEHVDRSNAQSIEYFVQLVEKRFKMARTLVYIYTARDKHKSIVHSENK